jgi:ABC-type nitrate/sulfonate/bicarbonate transport system ATPase subunit
MTARPGRIMADVPVPFSRPRDPTAPEFNDYRREIAQYLEQASTATADSTVMAP